MLNINKNPAAANPHAKTSLQASQLWHLLHIWVWNRVLPVLLLPLVGQTHHILTAGGKVHSPLQLLN